MASGIPAGARVRQDRGKAVGDHAASGANVARAMWQAADHEDEAFGPKRRGFVDGALVVVNCRLPSRGISRPGTCRRGNSR